MRKVLLALTGLMFLATILLIFFAGVGAFDEAPRAESFEPHRWISRGMLLVSLLALGAAALARAPGKLTGLTALVTGLVLLQSVIAVIAGAFEDQSAAVGNLVFGLHAMNALIIMGLSFTAFTRARGFAAGRAGEPAATGAGGDAATPTLAADS